MLPPIPTVPFTLMGPGYGFARHLSLTAESPESANRGVTIKSCQIAFTILRRRNIKLISRDLGAIQVAGKTVGYRNFSNAMALFLHLVLALRCVPGKATGGNPRNLGANIIAQIRFFW